MSKVNHEFFGEINTEEGVDEQFGEKLDDVRVLWEEEYNGIMTTLWYDSGYEFKVEVLDTFAEFLRNSENYFEKAREALKCYLKVDDEYIVFHKEELELDISNEICEFVEQMKIEAISLWAGENLISVDFMINPAVFMKKVIKEFWNVLKSEYENEYKENIFKNYSQTEHVLENFRTYLKDLFLKYPSNVDIVCVLASVELELRYEKNAIKLLEDFVLKYNEVINDVDKARIYTNLGFYYEADKKQDEYLLKADKLNSPFIETYKGLALTSFSNYERNKTIEDLDNSLMYFEKALKITKDYEIQFGYAVCLFEMKEYQKAKVIFEKLLSEYPDRMRLLLCTAYCEVYLGNKEEAIYYLKKVEVGQDEKYYLTTDDIADYQVFEAYYVLGEYDLFLEECEKVIFDYYFADWEHYYYTLWLKNKYEKFYECVSKYKNDILKNIEETKVDDDFSCEEEKQDYIKSYEEDLEKLITMSNKIQNENYKPIIKLELYPEYGCFLVDCIRHNF